MKWVYRKVHHVDWIFSKFYVTEEDGTFIFMTGRESIAKMICKLHNATLEAKADEKENENSN